MKAATGRGPDRALWLTWIAAAALALCSLSYVAWQQLGPLRNQVLQVDELYFSACAARGLVEGWTAVAGCHDNKAPLIYLLHAALQQLASPYDAVALKGLAAMLFAGIAAVVYRLARRAAPEQPASAGLAAILLLVCALVPDPSMLAVKTELLGAGLLLLALLFTPQAGSPLTWPRALAIGAAFGAAVMSKQTFGLMLPMLLWATLRPGNGATFGLQARHLLLVGLGALLPALLLAGLYAASGKLQEFLATTFLYPAIYGSATSVGLAKRLVWKFATASEFLRLAPIHVALVLAALAGPLRGNVGAGLRQALLLGAAVALLIMLASPMLFDYHAIPFWVLACPLGGAMIAQGNAAGGPARALALGALLCATLFALGSALQSNGHSSQKPLQGTEAMQPAAGRYAYVLGMAPQVYARGFIPASSIQFPWALPGTPATWAYHPPAPASPVFKTLHAQQQRNLARLYADFERTPPAYIAVIDRYARAVGSTHPHADVPGFDEYLARHCHLLGTLNDGRDNSGKLFACDLAR
ncbi:glycosyltransferase family 39 protein [Roseateles sp.]|uniref:glycosyltransferase family 39 protein n=1 Tax=Roseateles sp. TaxID=1971397 RepID=UPI0039E771E8